MLVSTFSFVGNCQLPFPSPPVAHPPSSLPYAKLKRNSNFDPGKNKCRSFQMAVSIIFLANQNNLSFRLTKNGIQIFGQKSPTQTISVSSEYLRIFFSKPNMVCSKQDFSESELKHLERANPGNIIFSYCKPGIISANICISSWKGISNITGLVNKEDFLFWKIIFEKLG
jgi:hypothetical protein